MNDQLRPDEAAVALAEIARRRAQVATLTILPTWFWWATAGLMIGFSIAVESRRPLVIGTGTAVFVLGVLVVTGLIVLGVLRRAQPRNNVSPAGVLAILGFVAVILAVTLPTGFALEAADVRYPATWGNVVAGSLMVVGGPLLMWFLRHTMVANGGGQR
jgi:hypothetical protein